MKNRFMIALAAFGMMLCGCSKGTDVAKFETSIEGIKEEASQTLHIKVTTDTKDHPTKLMVTSLQFEPNGMSKNAVRLSLVWNEYHEEFGDKMTNQKKDCHYEWFIDEPATVFDMDSKKKAILSYADDKKTGQMPIDCIEDIHRIDGHGKDKFIYTDMKLDAEKITEEMAEKMKVDADNIKTINVYQYRLGDVDRKNPIKFTSVDSTVWKI